jgi:phosphate:Na+ symporter
LKIGKYGLPIIGFSSFFYLFSKRDKIRFFAMAIMGIGMVFFGLELMKNGFKPMRAVPEFIEWFAMFDTSTYFGVLKSAMMGCLLTFIVQSSSATLAITMGLASTGIIGFETSAALVLGENIGTTVTAFLASIGAGTNAKRAAYAHIIFNILGVLWITAIFQMYLAGVKSFLGIEPGTMVMKDGVVTYPNIIMGIAAVHTGFNVANTIIFVPLIGYMEKLLLVIIPDEEVEEPKTLTKLDPSMIETPLIAIDNSHKEIIGMGVIAAEQMALLKEAVGGDSVKNVQVEAVFEKETALDMIQHEVSIFLTDLLATGLQHEITVEGREQLIMADEYESISDYIEKILKLHLRLRDADVSLPEEEKADIFELHDEVFSYLLMVNEGCAKRDMNILLKANPHSESITHMVRKVRTQHTERLSDVRMEPVVTMIFTDMLNDYRRVKDHALNIAEAVAGKK